MKGIVWDALLFSVVNYLWLKQLMSRNQCQSETRLSVPESVPAIWEKEDKAI